MLLVILVVLLLLVVGGPAVAWPNAGTWGWSPAGVLILVLFVLLVTGNLHL